MHNDFLTELMNHILEGAKIPKLQVERAVGPVLGFFLADVLTATLADDDDLSGQYHMLCPEFPLLGEKGFQSSNIDWLLYNEDRKALIFLELKTVDSSLSLAQAQTYIKTKLRVIDHNATFLNDDLVSIEKASSEPEKYAFVRHLLDNRLPGGIRTLADCRTLKIIYLVPAITKDNARHLARMDKTLSFSELADDIASPFAQEWRTIHHALRRLDERPDQQTPEGKNYQGIEDFERIIERCAQQGGQIMIGFTGGESALQTTSLEWLRQRKYKWDHTDTAQGKKKHTHWIPGDRFLALVKKTGV